MNDQTLNQQEPTKVEPSTVVATRPEPRVVNEKQKITDLSELFASNEAQRFVLKHPKTGNPLISERGEMAIWITSADSPACEEVKSEFAALNAGKPVSYAANKQLRMDILVAATTRFENMVANGKEITVENAEDFYNRAPVIRKLFEDQIGFDELFMKGAS